jgi:hypothetical protein
MCRAAAPRASGGTGKKGEITPRRWPLANGVGGPQSERKLTSRRHHVQRQRHEVGEHTAQLASMASVASNNDDAREENRCTWPTAVARKVSAPRCCTIMVNGGGVTTEDFAQRRCATLASDGGVTRAERAELLRHSGERRRYQMCSCTILEAMSESRADKEIRQEVGAASRIRTSPPPQRG